MKISTLLVAMVGILASSANAADWKIVANSDTHFAFVDTSSIVRHKNYRKAWVMWSEIESEKISAMDSKINGRSSKTLTYYNCEERTTFATQNTDYEDVLGGGKSIRTSRAQLNANGFDDVVPDSVGEQLFTFICSRKIK